MVFARGREGVSHMSLQLRSRRFQLRPLLAATLGALLLGGCGGLSNSDAKVLLENSDGALQKNIYVDLGFLNARCGQSPDTGKYALLQKAGLINIHPGNNTEVMTTDQGDKVLNDIGAQRMNLQDFKLLTGQQGCNVRSWSVPIATRELTEVKVTSTGSDSADVTYNWRWKPNELGKMFMADGKFYKSLPSKMQDSLSEGDEGHDLPLDNSLPHASKVRFVRDANGNWHIAQ